MPKNSASNWSTSSRSGRAATKAGAARVSAENAILQILLRADRLIESTPSRMLRQNASMLGRTGEAARHADDGDPLAAVETRRADVRGVLTTLMRGCFRSRPLRPPEACRCRGAPDSSVLATLEPSRAAAMARIVVRSNRATIGMPRPTGLQPLVHGHQQKRRPTDVEEVGVAIDTADAEHALPDRRDRLLGRTRRPIGRRVAAA